MKIRTRLSLWYGAVMFAALSTMGGLSYYEFVVQRYDARRQEPDGTRGRDAAPRPTTSPRRRGARRRNARGRGAGWASARPAARPLRRSPGHPAARGRARAGHGGGRRLVADAPLVGPHRGADPRGGADPRAEPARADRPVRQRRRTRPADRGVQRDDRAPRPVVPAHPGLHPARLPRAEDAADRHAGRDRDGVQRGGPHRLAARAAAESTRRGPAARQDRGRPLPAHEGRRRPGDAGPRAAATRRTRPRDRRGRPAPGPEPAHRSHPRRLRRR